LSERRWDVDGGSTGSKLRCHYFLLRKHGGQLSNEVTLNLAPSWNISNERAVEFWAALSFDAVLGKEIERTLEVSERVVALSRVGCVETRVACKIEEIHQTCTKRRTRL